MVIYNLQNFCPLGHIVLIQDFQIAIASLILLLDETNYTLVDPESEELFGFKLKRSLQRAQTRQVCKVSFYRNFFNNSLVTFYLNKWMDYSAFSSNGIITWIFSYYFFQHACASVKIFIYILSALGYYCERHASSFSWLC